MTEQEKQNECERICGEAGVRDMHRCAPEMCPILLDQWRNPKLKPKPEVMAKD